MCNSFRVLCIAIFVAFFGFANTADAEKLRAWLAFGQNPSVICNTLRVANRLPVSMMEGRGVRGQIRACELAVLDENYLSEETARKLPVGAELVFIVKAEHEPTGISTSTQIAELEKRLASAEEMSDFLFLQTASAIDENQNLIEKLAASEKENDELFQSGQDLFVDNDRLVAKVMALEETVADAKDQPTWLIVIASTIAGLFFGTLFGFYVTGDKIPASNSLPKRKPVLSVEENRLDPELQKQNEELGRKVKEMEGLLKALDDENYHLNNKLAEAEESVQKLNTKITVEEAKITELERVIVEQGDAARERRPVGISGTHAWVDVSRTGLVPVNTPPMLMRVLKVQAPCGQARELAELTLSQTDGDSLAHIAKCKACQEELSKHVNGTPSHPARALNKGSASLGRGTLPHRRLDS
jgi:predicted nuclease with TOPRIM domain